jgi:hypothetical protein
VRFSVQQVMETTRIERNCASHSTECKPQRNRYALEAFRLEEERRERAPIDRFFRTLPATHDLLAQSNWDGAELTSILRKLLCIDGDSDRIALSGPLVVLSPRAG